VKFFSAKRNVLWLWAIVQALAAPAYSVSAAERALIKVGEFSKPAFGTLRNATAGDLACYLEMKDDRGVVFEEMADFDLCEIKNMRRFRGKRLALTYEIASVLAAECDGNMDCGKRDRVALIKKVRLAPVKSRKK
jgi:hypothetical protein